MKWKIFEHLVIMIVNENFKGLFDTDNVIGCVALDQKHVAEHIVNYHNRIVKVLEEHIHDHVPNISVLREH